MKSVSSATYWLVVAGATFLFLKIGMVDAIVGKLVTAKARCFVLTSPFSWTIL